MVKRTKCLYKDSIIGIETIYTVINGKQINIPERLNNLRLKSRNNELFCPCGCGANLVLVAGEHNLREQHFRIKGRDEVLDCTYAEEGEISVNSKIILKCWLDDKLNSTDVQTRVPISGVDDTKRRHEFSLLSLSRGIGVNYSHEKENITDEKLDALERNGKGIHLIHIVDIQNMNTSGQFPEFLMKIQERQGYCLFLDPHKNDYYKSSLTAAVYRKNLDGFWEQILFAIDKLSAFDIGEVGEPSYHGAIIKDLAGIEIEKFDAKQEEIRQKRAIAKAEQEKARKEAEAEKKASEEKREIEEECLRKIAEENRIRREEEEAKKKAQKEAEKAQRLEQFIKSLPSLSFNTTNIITDPDGSRVFKCSYCGEIGHEKDFYTYQGSVGICRDCDQNNPKLKEERAAKALQRQQEAATVKKVDPGICPECGRRLVERNGRNGTFIGCTGYYSGCHYTRNHW